MPNGAEAGTQQHSWVEAPVIANRLPPRSTPCPLHHFNCETPSDRTTPLRERPPTLPEDAVESEAPHTQAHDSARWAAVGFISIAPRLGPRAVLTHPRTALKSLRVLKDLQSQPQRAEATGPKNTISGRRVPANSTVFPPSLK